MRICLCFPEPKPTSRNMVCVDFYKNFEIFLSLWLLNWPGGRVDGSEGVPGGLGWAVPDG